MGFTRTEIRVEVVGAEEGARAMRGLAAAEDKVSEAAIRERLAVGDAEAAIVKKIRAEQAAKRAIEDALKPTTEMTKQTGLLAKAGELASSGLTMLRKAAEVIPGMELGTIIAGVAAAVYGLYKAFGPATDATDKQTAAFKAQAAAARDLASAQRELLRGEVNAGGAALRQMLDRLGPGATPEAQDQVIRLAAQREQAARARDEAIQRSVRRAGGLVPVSDAEQKRIESLQAERNKVIETAQEKDGNSFKLSLRDRQAMAEIAKAYQGEIDKIRAGATKAADWRLSEVVNQTTADLANLDRQLRGMGAGPGGGVPRETAPSNGGASRVKAPAPPGISGFELQLPGMGTVRPVEAAQNAIRNGPGLADVAAYQEQSRQMQAQQLADEQLAMGQRNAMMAAHMQAVAAATTQQRDLFATLSDTASSSLGGMVDSAMNSATMLVDIVGTITGAFGAMATNMILSGDAGSKAIKKSVANALAGYSAQAFGLATLLTIAGAAAAATGPIFGWCAPQIFTAAGIAAAGGVALGLSARALGADKVGASPSGSRGGGSAGSGGGMASAAGTNPYRSESSAPQPIHIHIGSETVTRVVDGERRREARRDGISARAEAA